MQNAASFFFFSWPEKDLFTYHFIGSMAQVAIFVYSIITGFAFNDLARLENTIWKDKLFGYWTKLYIKSSIAGVSCTVSPLWKCINKELFFLSVVLIRIEKLFRVL